MREVEKKINLENAHYEELLLELQLKKKTHPAIASLAAATSASATNGGPGGLYTSSSTAAITSMGLGGLPGTTSSLIRDGHPPLTTMASLEGYMTDTSSVLGGHHHPLITISQPNGFKKGI